MSFILYIYISQEIFTLRNVIIIIVLVIVSCTVTISVARGAIEPPHLEIL